MAQFSLSNLTPLMRQYFEVKEERPEIVLLMRVGDFFEAYGEDAEIISRELEITLTGREDKQAGQRIPMAGVPYHAVERYIARLITRGFKVALCDQVEDPKLAKGLVKRRVTRVLTPGTVVEDALLDARRNNYLVAAITGERVPSGVGVVDVSTGEFLATEIPYGKGISKVVEEVARLQPSECLVRPDADPALVEEIRQNTNAVITVYGGNDQRRTARQQLLDHFGTQSLRGFGCDDYTAGLDAAALLLNYVRSTHHGAITHIRTMGAYSTDQFMMLDAATRRNLELTQSQIDGSKTKSLIHVLDRTITSMGGRLLRKWLDQPLLDVGMIRARHDGVEEFARDSLLRGDIRDALRAVADIERLTARVCSGAANARDLVALRVSLDQMEIVAAALSRLLPETTLSAERAVICGCPGELRDQLRRSIADEPPILLREGGLIRDGYDEELDALRGLRSGGKQFIAAIEEEERQKTGIRTLKVGFNAVFGYYIEVSKTNLASVPENYIRKQTTANAERFITPALKEHEAQVLGAEERIVEREYSLFVQIRQMVADQWSAPLLRLAGAIARIDVLSGLAETAAQLRFVRPEVDETLEITLHNARHPVVEQLHHGTLFVPNDAHMDGDRQRLHIITGPNAAGKSTFLRQVAVCVLLTQMGSFVPADSARIGVVDRIFTRVGAQDDLASGQSTFMVEMSETANIINNATNRSLVILDEVGRGTSTYDGLALAWAIAECLHSIGAKTLFATHYHQLNELENQLDGAKNYRIAVKEQGDHIVWLRKIMPGGTDKSYGIQVARLAGIPDPVLLRATEILRGLESNARQNGKGKLNIQSAQKRLQLTLFEAERHPVIDEIEQLDVSTLSPLEALTLLYDMQRRVREK
ncbi:MAG: DNA mismatch repair protein MutS [Capsulimonadaceae bacterium]|nr:DNA mismatch repair protein MutS [Capsulimonadaceae bacterium]